VVVGDGEIAVRHRVAGYRWGVRFPCGEAAQVRTRVMGSAGKTPYVDVVIEQRQGKLIPLWHPFPSRSAAAPLARDLARAVESEKTRHSVH
jgi:hypothetical protein